MTSYTDWSKLRVLPIPRNSNGTAHIGRRDMETGWICNDSCPACDEDAGNVCRHCNTPATWGHTPECPNHKDNRVENCPLLHCKGHSCTGCPHDGDCGWQEKEIELVFLEEILEEVLQEQ